MEAEAQLDYSMLINQADKEYDSTMEELNKRLERMSPYSIMEKQAKLTDDTIKILSGKPLKMYTI